MNFPIIGDPNLEVLTLYNMLATDGSPDEESAANPEITTVRSVFVFGPDKRIRLMLAYPMETARNFDEILRVIDSLRVTALYNTRALAASSQMLVPQAHGGAVRNRAGWRESLDCAFLSAFDHRVAARVPPLHPL
jgi:alkyl hydroperoxide reductase subunit AhpC